MKQLFRGGALAAALIYCNSLLAASAFSPTTISGVIVHDNGTDII